MLHVQVSVYCCAVMRVQVVCSQCVGVWLHLMLACVSVMFLLQMMHVQVRVCLRGGPGWGWTSPARISNAASHRAGRMADSPKNPGGELPEVGSRGLFAAICSPTRGEAPRPRAGCSISGHCVVVRLIDIRGAWMTAASL